MNGSLKHRLGAASCLLAFIACASSREGDLWNSVDGANGSSFDKANDASTEPQACVQKEQQARIAKRPVDILFAVDNSASMEQEIAEVEKQINQNFAARIEASEIDYRVIMISKHGPNSINEICVSAPLSGTNCNPIPPEPVETARFFQYNQEISSYNALCRIVHSFDHPDLFGKHPTGYAPLLRTGASKVIVVMTDDHVTPLQPYGCERSWDDQNTAEGGENAANQFESELFALPGSPFGTAAQRNYVFHSIIGVAPYDAANLALAHPPSGPIVLEKCSPGSEDPGTGYQALSTRSGGLRYPTCGLDYTTVFKEMATGVIEAARVDCEFAIPAPPAGEQLNLETVVPQYTPGGGGAPVDYQQVANVAACGPDKFYIEHERIKLCPATCTAVQKDTQAFIKILFGCMPRSVN